MRRSTHLLTILLHSCQIFCRTLSNLRISRALQRTQNRYRRIEVLALQVQFCHVQLVLLVAGIQLDRPSQSANRFIAFPLSAVSERQHAVSIGKLRIELDRSFELALHRFQPLRIDSKISRGLPLREQGGVVKNSRVVRVERCRLVEVFSCLRKLLLHQVQITQASQGRCIVRIGFQHRLKLLARLFLIVGRMQMNNQG